MANVFACSVAVGLLLAALPAAAQTAPTSSRQHERALRGDDLWSYGFHNNRRDLETLKRHLHEQNLLQQDFALEEAFAPSTLETFRQ